MTNKCLITAKTRIIDDALTALIYAYPVTGHSTSSQDSHLMYIWGKELMIWMTLDWNISEEDAWEFILTLAQRKMTLKDLIMDQKKELRKLRLSGKPLRDLVKKVVDTESINESVKFLSQLNRGKYAKELTEVELELVQKKIVLNYQLAVLNLIWEMLDWAKKKTKYIFQKEKSEAEKKLVKDPNIEYRNLSFSEIMKAQEKQDSLEKSTKKIGQATPMEIDMDAGESSEENDETNYQFTELRTNKVLKDQKNIKEVSPTGRLRNRRIYRKETKMSNQENETKKKRKWPKLEIERCIWDDNESPDSSDIDMVTEFDLLIEPSWKYIWNKENEAKSVGKIKEKIPQRDVIWKEKVRKRWNSVKDQKMRNELTLRLDEN